jgi:hypothetical protein
VKSLIVAVFLLFAASGVHGTEILEYPLPGLTGFYQDTPGGITSRAATVVYHGPSAHVIDIWIDLDGSADVGLLYCFGVPDTVAWSMVAEAAVRKNNETGLWYGSGWVEADGLFSIVQDIDPKNWQGPPFADLADGDRLIIEQGFAGSAFIAICTALEFGEGEITLARMRVEVEAAIPAEPSTWGRIKALYR